MTTVVCKQLNLAHVYYKRETARIHWWCYWRCCYEVLVIFYLILLILRYGGTSRTSFERNVSILFFYLLVKILSDVAKKIHLDQFYITELYSTATFKFSFSALSLHTHENVVAHIVEKRKLSLRVYYFESYKQQFSW